MDLPKNAHYDGLDRIVPNEPVEVNTEPTVKKLVRPHRSISMSQREPIETQKDEMDNKWEVVATYSTDETNIDGSRVAAIARTGNRYGFMLPDGSLKLLDEYGNKDVVVEGGTFALGALYDRTRDSLSVTPEVGIPGKNGEQLVETFAMFPSEQTGNN